MRKLLSILLSLLLLISAAAAEYEDEEIILEDDAEIADEAEKMQENPARDEFIDRIIALGQQKYEETNGRLMRAQYSGDIYICKNFTVYLFRQTRDDFRMAEYPDVPLVIPNNLPKEKCKPYYYGFLWEDVPASSGNPFYQAAQFIYDDSVSKATNMQNAVDFMKQVKRGDYFQMSADYQYGVGAHSAIMIADYDSEENLIRWMDSNMKGQKKNGERYALVQFDAEKSPEWWAEAFCHKKRGATIYRLRDDIILK